MILFALAALAATPAYGFKTYPLGMFLDDFRRETLPADKYGPKFVSCSDKIDNIYFRPLRRESKAGVVNCSFKQVIGGSETGTSVPLDQDHGVGATFSFFEGRLYTINLSGEITSFSQIVSSLIESTAGLYLMRKVFSKLKLALHFRSGPSLGREAARQLK